jgi:hypothetical protein
MIGSGIWMTEKVRRLSEGAASCALLQSLQAGRYAWLALSRFQKTQLGVWKKLTAALRM